MSANWLVEEAEEEIKNKLSFRLTIPLDSLTPNEDTFEVVKLNS
jgi:hypothetical protein